MASDAVTNTRSGADQPLEAYAKACASVGCRPNKTLSRLLASCPAIDAINLNVNVVGRKGANAVIELAAQLPTVRRLLLADNYLENDNVLFLVQRLQDHSALEEIDLSHNPISHAAGKALHVFARSRRQIIAIKLDGTLINRALVRMIEATCAANSQDVPAPATHDVEETTTGLVAVDDEAGAASTSAREDEEELSTMADEPAGGGESSSAAAVGESINIPAGQPEEDVVDYAPATPKTAVDFAVLPALAACGGLRYSAVRVLLAGVDMSAVVNANGGVERPCIAAIHAVAARRAARCPAVHALWCASVLPSDDTAAAVDAESSVRSVSGEPAVRDADTPATAAASPSPIRPRRLSCLREIVGDVAADASAEFPGLTLVIEAGNDEVNAAEERTAPQPSHSSTNMNTNEAVETTGAAEASSSAAVSRSAIDVIVESSPAEYAAVAVLRDALRGDQVASTDGATAAPEATAAAPEAAVVASEAPPKAVATPEAAASSVPERSRDNDSSNALSVVLAGSSDEGGHEALMLLSAVLSEQ